VNLASRLEGLCKTYGVPIIISETTKARIPDWAVVELDLVAVKGKEEAIRIYALLGDESMARSEGFAQKYAMHAGMLDAYRQQRWHEARDALNNCRPAEPRLAGLYDLYASRIADFVEMPPGPDWRGIYVAETK